MTTNPYAPPVAEVQDVPVAISNAELPFFAVSVGKLFLMSICTLNLYQVFWFYQQWKAIKRREGSDILPAARAFFSVFYCYQCFAAIRSQAKQLGLDASVAAGPLATCWIGILVIARVPATYWWISFCAIFFMLPIQGYANAVNRALAPGHDENRRISGWNWLVVVPGALLIILALAGALLPSS